jgi:hypothetical protein
MQFKKQAVEGGIRVYDLFNTKVELQFMRQDISVEFLEQFNKGIDLYVEGRWKEAWEELDNIIFVNENRLDAPAQTLLEYIESENNEAPKDWEGFRYISD